MTGQQVVGEPAQHVVGVDFGTLSGRALVVRVGDGAEVGAASTDYPHAVISDQLPGGGAALPPEWALQHPGDYLAVLGDAVPRAVAAAGVAAESIIGVAVDFTACTMLSVTADGTPLSELAELAERPHAWTKLWKHHAAQAQADRINALAAERGEPWLARYGGLISSEWAYAKALQILEEDPGIYQQMAHFVEATDWVTWRLTGELVRSACTIGYKAIRQDGRLPGEDFCADLDPRFAGFAAEKLSGPVAQLGDRAGTLTPEAAALTGLPAGIAVAVGNVDAHVTAPAARAVRPHTMVAIMGTSTCVIMNGAEAGEEPGLVPGMCGVVDGGISAGRWGYEAGQSGVGDIFGWYVDTCVPPRYHEEAAARQISVHELLTELSAAQRPGEHGLLALDWHSGNRSVLVDHDLSGLVVGLTLATRPEDVYRALVESTAYGLRYIVDSFNTAGVTVREIVATGGLLRNATLMQIYADVLNRPLSVTTSSQGPALGSAIHAAVAAGAYPDVTTASDAMGSVQPDAYRPDPAAAIAYAELYADYRTLYDYFGRGGNEVMHRLKRRRAATRAAVGHA